MKRTHSVNLKQNNKAKSVQHKIVRAESITIHTVKGEVRLLNSEIDDAWNRIMIKSK